MWSQTVAHIYALLARSQQSIDFGCVPLHTHTHMHIIVVYCCYFILLVHSNNEKKKNGEEAMSRGQAHGGGLPSNQETRNETVVLYQLNNYICSIEDQIYMALKHDQRPYGS